MIRFVAAAAAAIALVLASGPAPAQSQEPRTASPRVVNGQEGSMSDWPFLVALADKDAYRRSGFPVAQFCGGSLVAPDKVVTAAHCVHKRKAGSIVVGSPGPRGSLSSPSMRVSDVDSIAVNPSYQPKTDAGDIAVITLHTPFTGVATITPVTVPEAVELTADEAPVRVAGWGATNKREPWRYPDIFRTGNLVVFPDSACGGGEEFTYAGVTFVGYGPGEVDPTVMLCADGVRNARPVDACVGDSGGPLVGGSGDGLRLVGLVSWGPQACGTRFGSGVYTRVAAFTDFLVSAGVPFVPDPSTPRAPTIVGVTTTPESLTAIVQASEEGAAPQTFAVSARHSDGTTRECTMAAKPFPSATRCTISGLVADGTYVVTARAVSGAKASAPSVARTVVANGLPERPRIKEHSALGGGSVQFRVINMRGNGSPLLTRTVNCTSTGRPTRSADIGAGGLATVTALRPGKEYSCAAIVTNQYGEARSRTVTITAR